MVLVVLFSAQSAAAQPYLRLKTQNLDPVQNGVAIWADYNADGRPDVFQIGLTVIGGQPTLIARLRENGGPIGAPIPAEPPFHTTQFSLRGDFVPRWLADAAWGDFDNDGDLDLVAIGSATLNTPLTPVTTLHRNDGAEGFANVPHNIVDVHTGTVSWVDVDNDGDLDLLVSGVTASGDHTTRMYANNGTGRFFDDEAQLPGLAASASSWADFDGDGDHDLALSGVTSSGKPFADIFINDRGRLAPASAGLPQFGWGDVSWGDYDADGDPDLAISGGRLSPFLTDALGAVYRNDEGTLVDTYRARDGAAFLGRIAWTDLDNDGDLDLLTTGHRAVFGTNRIQSQIVTYQGGTFVPILNQCFLFPPQCEELADVSLSSVATFDLDGDNDLDAHLVGMLNDGTRVSALYENHLLNIGDPTSADNPAPWPLNYRPLPPDTMWAVVEGNAVTLDWSRARDSLLALPAALTPPEALTYNIRIGTAPGQGDVLSAPARTADHRPLLWAPGNVGANLRWRINNLNAGRYYWSVQTVDGNHATSPFGAEHTFEIPTQ